VVGVAQATTASGPTPTPLGSNVSVVVVTRNLSAGTQLLPDDLDTILLPRQEYNPDNDLTNPQQALGRILKNPLLSRQQLRRGDIIEGGFSTYMRNLVADKRLEPGKKAFAYATNDLSAVGGFISEGDLVDVVATYIFERKGDENNAFSSQTDQTNANAQQSQQNSVTSVQRPVILELSTKTVLQNVRVLKVIRFGPPVEPYRAGALKSTPTPGAVALDQAPSATTVAVGPGTPTPVPTVPPYEENGKQFPTSQILVLAVTDQEAEVLKFTREARVALSVSVLAGVNGANPQINAQVSADRSALLGVPVVHFTLRARPVDTSNPQDPALTIDKTSGVTYRTLVRDYGLPIPEAVFATSLNQR
jgi:Flp pilus assembly protein CpaB